jgi:hypothetical protein
MDPFATVAVTLHIVFWFFLLAVAAVFVAALIRGTIEDISDHKRIVAARSAQGYSPVGRKILVCAIMRLDRCGVSGIAHLTTSINPMIATTFSPRLSASGQSIDSKPRMPPIENSSVPVHLRHARPVMID